MNKFNIVLDIKKRSFINIEFVKNDTARIGITVNDNGTPITLFDEAHIVIKRKNEILGMFLITNSTYQFGAEIDIACDYECVVILKRGFEKVTTYPFNVKFSPEWLSSIVDPIINTDIITDLYARSNTNLEMILQLFDTTLDHTTVLQSLQQEIPNKLDKVTPTSQSINGEVVFQTKAVFQNGATFVGANTEVITETVKTKNDEIILREGAVTPLPNGKLARLVAWLYNGIKNGILGFDNQGFARVGDEGDEQLIATIDEVANLHQDGQVKYDKLNYRLYTENPTPLYTDLILNQAITPTTQNAVAELKELLGSQQVKVKPAELLIANQAVSPTIKNSLIETNGQFTIDRKVDEKLATFLRVNTVANIYTDLHVFDIINHSQMALQPIIIDNVTYIYSTSDNTINSWRISSSLINEILIRTSKGIVFTNPLTVTYQLAIPNPKDKLIVDGDIIGIDTSPINVDYVNIATMFDGKALSFPLVEATLEGFQPQTITTTDDIQNINKWSRRTLTDCSIRLIVAKGTTLPQSQTLLVGKKLTYQLTTPRLALTDGISAVTNPKIITSLNDIEKSRVEVLGDYYLGDSIKYINGKFIDERVKTKVNLWEFSGTIIAPSLTNTYKFIFNNFVSTYNLFNNGINSFVNTVNFLQSETDIRHYYISNSLNLFIEKPLIDEITFLSMTPQEKLIFPTFVTTLTLPQKMLLYCYRNTIQGVFEKVNMTTNDTSIKGLLETVENGIVTFVSDGLINEATITMANNDKAEMTILKNEIFRISAR